MDFYKWLTTNIEIIAATIATAFGGGYMGKKFKDKEQDERIKVIASKVNKMESRMITAENEIKINTLFDKQFREDSKEFRETVNTMFSEIKLKQEKIYDYLLNEKK
jgi:hypothetical protein